MRFGQAPAPFGFSDEAKRASDVVNLALIADPEGNRNRWIAIRLSDGGSDGVLYDTPADAAWHQLHYQMCMYVQIPWSGLPAREAEILLAYHRRVYDAGNRPPYLDGFVPPVPRLQEFL